MLKLKPTTKKEKSSPPSSSTQAKQFNASTSLTERKPKQQWSPCKYSIPLFLIQLAHSNLFQSTKLDSRPSSSSNGGRTHTSHSISNLISNGSSSSPASPATNTMGASKNSFTIDNILGQQSSASAPTTSLSSTNYETQELFKSNLLFSNYLKSSATPSYASSSSSSSSSSQSPFYNLSNMAFVPVQASVFSESSYNSTAAYFLFKS